MKKINSVIGIFLLVFIGSIVYSNFKGSFNLQNYSNSSGNVTEAIQNYLPQINGRANLNFIYWEHMPITYKISHDNFCGKAIERRLFEAFSILENKTDNVLSFKRDDLDGLLVINCYGDVHYINNDWFIAGEGGPTTMGRKIIGGEINFYNARLDNTFGGGCIDYPDTELHEILNTFGFGHVDWHVKRSIMHDGSGLTCAKLDNDIAECLKNIYSNGAKGTSCEGLSTI